MVSYAFWNNKGGIGKSYLCFVAATEYAHKFPNADVYVIDLCPQANVSETLLSISEYDSALNKLISKPVRATVGGYLEARLNSPFSMINDASAEQFVTQPSKFNSYLADNLYLVCGDNILEIISEAMRQTSQLSIPVNSWTLVMNWIKDLTVYLQKRSGEREAVIIMDCNPSFAIYTQLAIAAADYLVVPFTPDESSHRAIKNVIALVYGIELEDTKLKAYAKINFNKRASDEGLKLPRLHSFVSNRVTMYEGQESKAFKAISKTIKNTVNNIFQNYRNLFSDVQDKPSKGFVSIPDYHSACVISSSLGIPMYKMKPGPKDFRGERVQINKGPLDKYRDSLEDFVDRL